MGSIRKKILDPLCLFAAAFAVWMLFFDDQNLFVQYRLYQTWNKLHQDRLHYMDQIERMEKEKRELLHNEASLEKFAREKYCMKRPEETLYVVVDPQPRQ